VDPEVVVKELAVVKATSKRVARRKKSFVGNEEFILCCGLDVGFMFYVLVFLE